jgi:2'-5' RNA ligase
MRLFLAAEPDGALREALAEAVGRLRVAAPRVRWVAAEKLHLTLKFCGDVGDPAALAAEVRRECSSVAAVGLEVAGVGRFPPRGPARVVWAGCRGDVAAAVAVAEACERAAGRVGVAREVKHPFSPHLTIGRVREGRDAGGLEEAIRPFAERVFGSLRIERVTLFRSDLRPDGPVYTAVERIPLTAKP